MSIQKPVNLFVTFSRGFLELGLGRGRGRWRELKSSQVWS